MVSAYVEPTDIVTHDEENIGPLVLRGRRSHWPYRRQTRGENCRQSGRRSRVMAL